MSGIVLLALRLLTALMLYAFLGWALWLLWRTMQQQPAKTATALDPLSIQITHHQQSSTQVFNSPEILIGRAPQCECYIDSKTVSTRHARLHFHHGQWWAEDLGSTNGTLLNQEKLLEPTVVVPGDQLRCGEVELLIQPQE